MCTLLSVPVMECGTLTLSLVWTALSLQSLIEQVDFLMFYYSSTSGMIK